MMKQEQEEKQQQNKKQKSVGLPDIITTFAAPFLKSVNQRFCTCLQRFGYI
jgi:hypothetical protein